MPAFAERLPRITTTQLARRELRLQSIFDATRSLHPASIIAQLRREERAFQRLFWESGTLADKVAAHKPLMACRSMILDIICWPKPPTLKQGQRPDCLPGMRNARANLVLDTLPPDPLDYATAPKPTGSP